MLVEVNFLLHIIFLWYRCEGNMWKCATCDVDLQCRVVQWNCRPCLTDIVCHSVGD